MQKSTKNNEINNPPKAKDCHFSDEKNIRAYIKNTLLEFEAEKKGTKSEKNKEKSDFDSEFLSKKHSKSGKRKRVERELEPIEVLYKRARSLYEERNKEFDLDFVFGEGGEKVGKERKSSVREQKWTYDILTKGTFDDKISAIMLYIKNNPKQTLKYLEIFINMIFNKNRRQTESILLGLKDIFLSDILNNRKHLPFNKVFNNANLGHVNDFKLIDSYYEDKIHSLYLNFLQHYIIYN